jgi:hypothetical protein
VQIFLKKLTKNLVKKNHTFIELFWSSIMDILITIVQLSNEEFDDYKKQIQASNLSRFTQNGLLHLLKTALEHTDQARAMGWVD